MILLIKIYLYIIIYMDVAHVIRATRKSGVEAREHRGIVRGTDPKTWRALSAMRSVADMKRACGIERRNPLE